MTRDPEIEARVERLLEQMTLEEKAEQMHGLQITPVDDLYLTPENARLGIPGFRMVDGPRGVRAGAATAFPVAMARGATFDPGLEHRIGEAIGKETLARGGDVLLAPCVNLPRHPRWGRAQEVYGEDPHHLGVMGAAFVRGAQKHVVASVKHFAVNSIENNRFTVSANLSERTLREVYLPHFKKIVDAGVGSVMSAYNRVNGTWCGENDHLLGDILKREWGFDGFVESDWIFGVHSTAASARAGLDIEMPAPAHFGAKLCEAVAAGELDEAVLDDAVRRILRTKLRFGLFERERARPDESVVACADHVVLAREAARKSIVLLKNDGGVLPFDRARLRTLAVVGALADQANLGDRGSSFVRPPYAVTPLAGLRGRLAGVAISHVETDEPTPADLEGIAAADAAVVVVGLTSADEGEGQITVGDRAHLELTQAQRALVRAVAGANPRTVVVLEGGSAIAMEDWIDLPRAILMAWYPGLEGGTAIAEVLLGEANPSGKLPISFPRSESQLPPFVNDRDEVEYDGLHGYWRLDHDRAEPRFPFGFGLSYTRFALSALSLEASVLAPDGVLRARLEVTNTGAVAGDEVVQLYVGCAGSRVERPPRVLAAFLRVAVAPGERRTVALEVPIADLAYWDAASRAWIIEEMSYSAHVGTSSRDLPLAAEFEVRGS
jgi:beta-glucosidase